MTTSKILRLVFHNWFWSYFIRDKHIDTYVDLAKARGSFYMNSGMQITPQVFRDLINHYCSTHNYSLNPKNAKGFHKESNRILMKVNGKVVEFIYIGMDDTVINNKTFQVLVNYPGSYFKKGEIIEVVDGKFVMKILDMNYSFEIDYFSKYPDVFKEL